MNPTKENAPTAIRALGRTKRELKYKRIPAYGKQFLSMRQSCKVPARRVMVTFDWDLAKAYPRIVIVGDTPVDEFNFSYLAGLPVQIVYRRKDAHRVSSVVGEIMKVNPSFLATFALDLVGICDVATIIKPYELQREAA